MKRLTVRDIMTTDIITTRVSTPFKEIATTLAEHAISALPVLDEHGQLVGVVSEADLLPKEGFRGDPHLTGWFGSRRTRLDQAKATGARAGDVMTAPAITIDADASVAQAARLMDRRRVKRLPVMDADGALIGIVSRADLVRVFLISDAELRDEINTELFDRILLTEPGTIDVEVDDGVVTLSGELERTSSIEVAERLARGISGVVDVVNKLTYRWDNAEGGMSRLMRS